MARMTTKTAPTPDATRTPGDPRGVFFFKRGKSSEFSLEQLVKLAARAGLKPQLKLVNAD